MTKAELIIFADYLRDTDSYCEHFTDNQLEHLADFCHSQNPAFKRDRWLGYIHGENGKNGGRTEHSRQRTTAARIFNRNQERNFKKAKKGGQ